MTPRERGREKRKEEGIRMKGQSPAHTDNMQEFQMLSVLHDVALYAIGKNCFVLSKDYSILFCF